MALRRVLILGPAPAHARLIGLVEGLGMVAQPDGGPAALRRGGIDVVCGAPPPDGEGAAVLAAFADDGGGVVTLGPWNRSSGQLGGYALLGVLGSAGPPGDPAELRLDGTDHPVVRNLPRRSGRRAVVPSARLDPSVVVLGRVGTSAALWTVAHGSGRVLHHGVVTGDDLLDDPLHRTVIGRALRWVIEAI